MTKFVGMKDILVLKSLNILSKRGIKGLYIYAVNENLRNHLLKLQEKRDAGASL